jgi:hypothetical protein
MTTRNARQRKANPQGVARTLTQYLAPVCLAVGLGAHPSLARGAEITDVADAADVVVIGNTTHEDFLDVYIGTRFDGQWGSGRITREPVRASETAGCTKSSPRGCLPVDELAFKRVILTQTVTAEIGLFHDLALTLELPFVIADNLSFGYAKGVDELNSSVDFLGQDPAADGYIPHDFATYHRGLGPLGVGLRFAPLSDERDDTKPTWVLELTWKMPGTATTHRPKDPDEKAPSKSDPFPVGDGVHRLIFGTAFSKRLGNFGGVGLDPADTRRGYVDPYL